MTTLSQPRCGASGSASRQWITAWPRHWKRVDRGHRERQHPRGANTPGSIHAKGRTDIATCATVRR